MNKLHPELDTIKQLYRQEAKKLYHSLREGKPFEELQGQRQLVARLWSRLMTRDTVAAPRYSR